ncbi:hypothetical protein T484DRAFT_1877866, partial [Baffinella frigidus]
MVSSSRLASGENSNLETGQYRMDQVLGLVQKCVSVAAGPHHTLAVIAVASNPPPPPPPPVEEEEDKMQEDALSLDHPVSEEEEEEEEGMGAAAGTRGVNFAGGNFKRGGNFKGVPTLRYFAEVAASNLVDVSNVASCANLTDSLPAPTLREYTIEFIFRNLDFCLASGAVSELSPECLRQVEARLKKELQGRARSEAGLPQISDPEAGPDHATNGSNDRSLENGSNDVEDEAAWHAFYEQELENAEFPEGGAGLDEDDEQFFMEMDAMDQMSVGTRLSHLGGRPLSRSERTGPPRDWLG